MYYAHNAYKSQEQFVYTTNLTIKVCCGMLTVLKHERIVKDILGDFMNKDDKKSFRKAMLLKRDAIPYENRIEADNARNESIRKWDTYKDAELLLFYVSYRSEADTLQLIKEALALAPYSAERAAKLAEAEKLLLEDMAVIPLQFNTEYCLISDDLSKVGSSIFGFRYFNKAKLKGYEKFLETEAEPQA